MNESSKVESLATWGCWVSGVALLLVAIAAGGLSLAINVIAGLSVGLPIAIMFGLSDVGKVLIPIVCQAIGWDSRMTTIYRAAAIVSVSCAVFTVVDMFGTQFAELDVGKQKIIAAEQVYADLKANAVAARKMADDEAKRGGCGENCDKLIKIAEAADKKVNQAAEDIKKTRSEVGVTITGIGFIAKDFLGVDPTTANVTVTAIKVAMGIAIMELICSLVGAASALIGIAMSRSKKKKTPQKKAAPKTTAKKKAAPQPKPQPVKVEVQKPSRKWTAAQTVAYLDRTLNKEPENV